MMDKNLEYYLNLPYTIEILPEPEGGYFIRVKELPGCFSQGETPEEAFRNIQEAKHLWLEVAIEVKHPVPEPRQEENYSGKFVLRLPKSLHRELVNQAEREKVSLNQLVNVLLARSMGRASDSLTISDFGFQYVDSLPRKISDKNNLEK
jgi:antitoxin HicB